MIPMKRYHLIELEDQGWFNAAIRDGITDFLQFAIAKGGVYESIAHRLSRSVHATGARGILDLCTGAGGPWKKMASQLDGVDTGDLEIRLSDYYPNHGALRHLMESTNGIVTYLSSPIDARNAPNQPNQFRTLFSSFHHFKPSDAKRILGDAVEKSNGIAIFECTQRHPLVITYMLLTPIFAVLTAPFIRPFRWRRLFWTYVIPAIPLAIMFDGIVSCLRTYTPEELLSLARQADPEQRFTWDAGVERFNYLPVGITYLIGERRGANSNGHNGPAR